MFIVWVVLCSSFTCLVALDEDCETGGKRGTCQYFRNCSYAQNEVKANKNPDICDFEGLEAIVCCPYVSRFPAFIGISKPEKIETESLSEIKCLKFYPIPKFPILIIGGEESLAKEFPHMAIIGFGEETDKKWQCGGSLISKKFVLTAAHCITSSLGPAKWVRLGDVDLSTNNDVADPKDFSVKSRISHPSYRPPSRYHDIALLELDRPVRMSLFVSPACLHTRKETHKKTFTATGWGRKEFNGDYSSYLMKIDLDHVNISGCRKSYENIPRRLLPDGIQDDTQICAGGVIGKDTCQGDSGGPLQVKNIGRTFAVKVNTLIGITSFGKACGLSPSPGVYTRVSYYVPWIESIVWPNETWQENDEESLFLI